MKVPLSWLNDYITLAAPPADIARRLTFSGMELEGLTTLGASADGIIVAEVRAVEKHPQADKLSVCRVFDGQNEVQVVCGAPNVAAGGKYPFAPIGAVLLGGELKIKKAKLRGVESFGMLCSAAELGLSDDHSGLMTLDPSAVPGVPMAELLGPPDSVLELEITPNRPDCLSMIGVARELSALYGTPLRKPDPEVTETGGDAAAEITVEVEQRSDCPRYTARILHQVRVGPSPAWMKDRLEKAGIRSINNVVDITNYVLLETGHPLHAFDACRLQGGKIQVRRAQPGERLTTLDGIERELDPNMLVIADAEKPVALAGVMGGAGSEIQDDTTDILLESATFNPALVRYASRSFQLFTDSSYRFERGVNAETVEWASRRAAQLLIELAGASLARGVVDIRTPPAPLRRITLRLDRVRTLLGLQLPDKQIIAILRSIELTAGEPDNGVVDVVIPDFRFDLEREVDLIEEVARLHGLEHIPPAPSATPPIPGADDTPVKQVAALRDACVDFGLQEIVTYSLVAESLLNGFDPDDAPRRIALPRPVTVDQAILRTALTPQIVETLGRNRARQVQQAAVFELGKVYHLGAGEAPHQETRRLAIGLMGRPAHRGVWQRKPPTREEMFDWIKGLWERLAGRQRLPEWSLAPDRIPFLETGYGFRLSIEGRACGWIGLIAPGPRKEWRLHDPIAVLEVDAAPLCHRPPPRITYQPIPAYPSVGRDVAVIADAALTHETLVATMQKSGPPELENIQLFDIFMGEAVGTGKRSLAYALTYRSANRTLTDDEVNGYHETIKTTLKKELNVEIREG
ncbi:MAG TPA: phenylalanine--tRNA ligase subunit beta [Kiritimatiellia bacterium]|nr:phenylalanine--tRNA ligase subunit beta [Kiritimatiellia bacterium]